MVVIEDSNIGGFIVVRGRYLEFAAHIQFLVGYIRPDADIASPIIQKKIGRGIGVGSGVG